jgi:predicted DNA-binding transcriptional regulator YafY
MDEQFRQYRFARIEGQRITQAELETQFKDGITDLDALDKAIEQFLTKQAAPWRTTDLEQEGFREGIRMAALEFYWHNRQYIRRLILGHSSGSE